MTEQPGLPLTTGEGNTAGSRKCESCGCVVPVRETVPPSGFLDWTPQDVPALLAECGRLREQLDAARQALEAAEPGLSFPPADCTNNCMDGPCDCSGKWRVTAWVIDVPALRAALGVEGPAEEA